MPGEDGDAERFAAADEQGRPPSFVADPELAKDIEIAEMLRLQGAALAPRHDERARVRARVLAEIARQSARTRLPGVSDTVPVGQVLRPVFPTVPVAPAWADSLFTTPTPTPIPAAAAAAAGAPTADPWAGATASTQRLHPVAGRAKRADWADRTSAERELDPRKSGTRRTGGGGWGIDTTGPDTTGPDTTELDTAAIDMTGLDTTALRVTAVAGTAVDRTGVGATVGMPAVGTADPAPDEPAPAPDRRGRHPRHGRPNRPAGRAGGAARTGRSGGSLRRRLAVAGATVVLAVMAVAGSVFASRDALPGDSLYGVKRVAESVGDALTVGDAARAQRELDAATTRLDEVQTLVTRDPSNADPRLVQSAIQDFDTLTGAGSRALLTSPAAGGPAVLAGLAAWASDQVDELSALRIDLPEPARPDAEGTITLLDRLRVRIEQLSARASCTNQTSGAADDLGPIPAAGACAPGPVTAGGRQVAGPSTSPSPVPSAAAAAPTGASDPDGPTTPAAVPPSTSVGRPGSGQPGSGRTGSGQTGSGQTGNGQTGNGQTAGGQSGGSAAKTAAGTDTPTSGSRAPDPDVDIPLPKVSVPPLPGFPGITVG